MHRVSESVLKASSPARATIRSGGLHSIVVSYPGRIGYWRVGIPPSGPMDDFAFRYGNQAVGNNDINSAGLEMTYKGPVMEFDSECVICLTGAQISGATLTTGTAGASSNNKAHNISNMWWRPIEVSAGSVLSLDAGISSNHVGVRSYLSINNNGFSIPDYLGSKTSFPTRFGGLHNAGTVLQPDDVLPYHSIRPSAHGNFDAWDEAVAAVPKDYFADAESHVWDIGILVGPQSNNDYITESDAQVLYNTQFQVSHNASRLGIRLNIVNDGASSSSAGEDASELLANWPQFARPDGGEGGSHPSNLIDNPYAIGAINFTGNHPVILTVDGPSLGGFVCPVTVPSNEIWKIGQLKPNDRVKFHVLDLPTTLRNRFQTETMLASINPNPPHASNTSKTSEISKNASETSETSKIVEIPETSSKSVKIVENTIKPFASPIRAVAEKVVVPLDAECLETTMAAYAPLSGADSRALLREVEENEERNQPRVCYRLAGDKCLLVEYGRDVLDLNVRVRVHKLEELIVKSPHVSEGVIDTTPGVRTLLIEFNPFVCPLPRLLETLQDLELQLEDVMDLQKNEIVIETNKYRLPLVFGDEWTRGAIERYMNEVRGEAVYLPSNVEFICENNGLNSVDELRDMVFETTYCALGLGDVYLGAPCAVAMDPRQRLNVPKYNPSRNYTPEGAVGLGGQYMCIYPMESPGGYQLVGRTLPIWDTQEPKPWLLDMFDEISFYPVTRDELLKEREEFKKPDSRQRCIQVEKGEFNLNEYNKKYMQNEDIQREVKKLRAKQLKHQKMNTDLDNAILARLSQSVENMKGLCHYLAQMVVNGPKFGTNAYVYIRENGLDLDLDYKYLIKPLKVGEQLTVVDKGSNNKQYSIKLISRNPSMSTGDGSDSEDGLKRYDLKFTINSIPLTTQVVAEANETSANVEDMGEHGVGSEKKAVLDGGNFVSVSAPMPGKIVRVVVNEMDVVEEGSCVAVVSAMKMETEIRSPVTGRVERIYATVEEVLAAGDVVVHILPK